MSATKSVSSEAVALYLGLDPEKPYDVPQPLLFQTLNSMQRDLSTELLLLQKSMIMIERRLMRIRQHAEMFAAMCRWIKTDAGAC
jgi:hypothetical protein